MEISRRISPQPGTALFGAKRIPGYCYLTAGYEKSENPDESSLFGMLSPEFTTILLP